MPAEPREANMGCINNSLALQVPTGFSQQAPPSKIRGATSQSLFLYRCSHGALSEWVALVQIAGPHVFVSCPCLMTMH